LLVFAAGVLLGAAIWWTSPWLTGEAEPWDAQGRHYLGALFFAGAVAAAFLPKAFWLAPIGVYVGQLLYGIYLFEPKDGSLWPLGMVLAAFYCVAALAGALASAILIWLIRVLLAVCRFFLGRQRQAE
jgi:hypothetical protein